MVDKIQDISYDLQIYNNYADYPIVWSASIENFDFEKLLTHPNPEIREFSFILITKYLKYEDKTTVIPLMIIYLKQDWEIHFEYFKTYFGFRKSTSCSNRYQSMSFAGKLKKYPCKTQEEMMNKCNRICSTLTIKNTIENKSLVRKKF